MTDWKRQMRALDKVEKVLYIAVSITSVVVFTLIIAIVRQHTTCEPLCEAIDKRSAGITMPPWGADLQCLCETKNRVLVPVP